MSNNIRRSVSSPVSDLQRIREQRFAMPCHRKRYHVEVIKINGSFNGIIESCPIPESGTRFRPENHLRNAVINTNPLPLYLSQHSLQQSRYVHPNVRLYNRTLPFLYIFEHYWWIKPLPWCCSSEYVEYTGYFTRFRSTNEVIRPLRNVQQICDAWIFNFIHLS